MSTNKRDMRTTKSVFLLGLLLLLSATSLNACGVFGGSGGQQMHSYMFSPREFRQMGEVDSDLVLLVSPVRSVGYGNFHMTYTLRNYERTYYAFSEWADSPPRMIEPLLIQAMEASGLFYAVIDTTSSIAADLRLEANLLVLQHEFHTNPSQGRIVLRVQITDLHTYRVLATRLFETTVTAVSEDAYGGVYALNLALEQILDDLADFFVEILESRADERF